DIKATPTVGGPVDRIRVIASTQPLPDLTGGVAHKCYRVFEGRPDQERIVSMLRGAVLVKKEQGSNSSSGPRVSDAELSYHVEPGAK
ncbi:MAG: hypothetical protein ACRCZF_00325, partial [Gemmataceae bacterium]